MLLGGQILPEISENIEVKKTKAHLLALTGLPHRQDAELKMKI